MGNWDCVRNTVSFSSYMGGKGYNTYYVREKEGT